jgi:septum formation protein
MAERPRLAGSGRLILASASAARAAMLETAGLVFERRGVAVDEAELKAALRAEGANADAVALALAELKAGRVSAGVPGAFVIGADQMLVEGGRWLDKPESRAAAADQLRSLRGKSHRLVSAVAVFRDGQRLWGTVDGATLLMRDFSDAFLERYLDAAGPAVTGAVGAYHLEGLGAQLFRRVDGDYFTVLGLPLLPLLDFLRGHDIVPT